MNAARGTLPPRITVLGVGNTLMGDDGVGVAAVSGLLAGSRPAGDERGDADCADVREASAFGVSGVGPVSAIAGRHLPDALGPGIDVVLGETAGLALLKHFRASEVVIAVDALDAASEGAVAGEIFRFTPDQIGAVSLRSNNIHGMGLPHLVAAARLVGADPEVVVFAVQVGDVRPRPDTLTPAVAKAAAAVGELIRDELADRRRTVRAHRAHTPV